MSTLRVSILLLFLVLAGFVVTGCDEGQSPTGTPDPSEPYLAQDYFPFTPGESHQFTNHVDGEPVTTESWTVLSSAQYHDRQAYEVVFTLRDLDEVELGSDTTWYAFDADSVYFYNDSSGEWEQDPFLSGWCEEDPPATHEFTRVHEELGGLTVEYVAGYEGDGFEYTVGSTTYPHCRKITEDAVVVGQNHVASGARYYAAGIGLVYSDLTDTYHVGDTEITLHREKFRVE